VYVVIIRGPSYEEVVKEITSKGISFHLVDSSIINEEELIREIRGLPPQIRGKIRYGKGKPLPLTRGGRLNYVNTAILLIYENDRLIDVYPKQLGERYFSPLDWSRDMEFKTSYLYEEPMVALLKDKPELVNARRVLKVHEEVIKGKEVIGEIDLLFEDDNGNKVLVEVEEIVREKAITQLLALAKVLKDKGIKLSRMIIVGLDTDFKSLKAAKEAGIEIWRVRLEKLT